MQYHPAVLCLAVISTLSIQPTSGKSNDVLQQDRLDFGSCICQQECPTAPSGLNVTLVETIVRTLLSTQTSQAKLIESTLDAMNSRIASFDSVANGLVEEMQNLRESVAEVLEGMGPGTDVPEEYRPTYRVFHVGSSEGRYQYTLSQAREVCAERNMKLANLNQLEAAFRQGFGTCACGWLDEGIVRYAVQWPEDWCGGATEQPGVRGCDWQSTWDAYCFNDRSMWPENQ